MKEPKESKISCEKFQVDWVTKEWNNRADIPQHVVTMLNNFPAQLHPMAQFSAAITALNLGSKFAKAYSDNVHKSKYWEVCISSLVLCFEVKIKLTFCLSLFMKIQWI